MQELDLELIRKEIDKADSQLAEVLEKRLQLVMQVAAFKKSKGMPVKDKNREAKVIAKVASLLENKDYSIAVKNIMRGIIDQACVLEETALVEPTEPLRWLVLDLQAPLPIRRWRIISVAVSLIAIITIPLKRSLPAFPMGTWITPCCPSKTAPLVASPRFTTYCARQTAILWVSNA